MTDRPAVQNFDWGLLGLAFALAAMGIVTLYSAVNAGEERFQEILVVKQLIWYCVGVAIIIVSLLFNYKSLNRWAYTVYWICICQLAAVLLFGKYVAGSRRWLALGPVSIQPSELVKIAVIIMLARYYAKIVNPKGLSFRELLYPFIITGIPFALIVKQPDLGTAMLVLLIAASVTFFVKIEIRSLSYLAIVCTMAAPLLWLGLKGYQKQRILTFLDPDLDPLGAGYHIIQSKIAIGSGMLSGKGLLKGTQNALSFLPEQHTDFIFSVMSEEMGFAGSLFTILLFLMLIVWGLNIAYGCRDPFGTILSVGITAMIFWQVFINIGMVMGLVPVVGVPLPFISYGGSSVMTMMTCIAILMNVSMRHSFN
ncbi:MAG: rod shape-determining protein RodA [Desulfobacteraceae bacterium IS3]|nr:MAG: rod shape-determining protein RodA [Desulfobacteraceae bacterium IS3]